MLTIDCIGTRRVDNIKGFEQLKRVADNCKAIIYGGHFRLFTIAQESDLSCGRCDPFAEDALAKESVDQGAFAGIEFTHYNNQKEFIQLSDSFAERIQILQRKTEGFKLFQDAV